MTFSIFYRKLVKSIFSMKQGIYQLRAIRRKLGKITIKRLLLCQNRIITKLQTLNHKRKISGRGLHLNTLLKINSTGLHKLKTISFPNTHIKFMNGFTSRSSEPIGVGNPRIRISYCSYLPSKFEPRFLQDDGQSRNK